jgi:hypothetical protein
MAIDHRRRRRRTAAVDTHRDRTRLAVLDLDTDRVDVAAGFRAALVQRIADDAEHARRQVGADRGELPQRGV